jgi:hypothetical protein
LFLSPAAFRAQRVYPGQRDPQTEQVHRLRKMHVETGFVPTFLVGRGEIGAHRDRGYVGILSSYFGNEIVTILVGQTNIAEDHVHALLFEKPEAARGGIARGNVMSPAAENRRKGALSIWMVFDQEDGAHERKATKGAATSYSANDPPLAGCLAMPKVIEFHGTHDVTPRESAP